MIDPHFNEACAEAFTFSEYRYCIMENDGKFQWRWMDKIPPGYSNNPAVSPEFESLHTAIEWGRKRNLRHGRSDGWAPITVVDA